MRRTIRQQLTLTLPLLPFAKAREYDEISKVLDSLPQAAELVLEDLLEGGVNPDVGRDGMTGEQVLRAKIVKQSEGFSYEDLAFETAANEIYRAFCRIEPGQTWTKSRLHRNLSALSAETLEKINRLGLGLAKEEGIEDGQTVAIDPTSVQTNIHFPADSKLLFDVMRVLTRFMWAAVRVFVTDTFRDHLKQAAALDWRISYARTKEARKPLYLDLLEIAEETMSDARRLSRRLEAVDPVFQEPARELAKAVRDALRLGERVQDQTIRRVVKDQTVPAREKILSIFEPHTELIKQGKKTFFGHKVTFATGASGLTLDVVVEDGNPADVTLALPRLDRLTEIYGKAPSEAVFDGSFASPANLQGAKERGVKNVVFTKKRSLNTQDMAETQKDYDRLRRFRTIVERGIGFLKDSFAMARCLWKGLAGFMAYVWTSVLSANLLIFARRRLELERLGVT